MPYRKIVFANNEIYHVYNRSVGKIPILLDTRTNERLLDVINYYRYGNLTLRYSFFRRLQKKQKEELLESLNKNNPKLVEILTFCLMPNHLHFLLKQLQTNGIAQFMRNTQNSYAKFFNTKYNRVGALFQALFKAVRIETTEQLLHVSRYIHLNPVTSFIIKLEGLEDYPWTSFPEYTKKRTLPFINTKIIVENFRSAAKYKEFVFDQADYQKELAKIKHLTLKS